MGQVSKLGPLELRYYGLVYVLGFIATFFYLRYITKNKNIKLIKGGQWDLSVIIGKDYKELDSFEIVKKYYPPF